MQTPMYTLKFKRTRQLFWRRYRNIVGHTYEPNLDRLTVHRASGAIAEIAKWSECCARLGTDYVYAASAAAKKPARS